MAQDRQQLLKLINFVDTLCQQPGNEWFRQALQRRLSSNATQPASSASPSSERSTVCLAIGEKVSRIERYLALDYDTDTAQSSIDYSRIAHEATRHALESDNREMQRSRYHLRGHNGDNFGDYCLYAHFQAEQLLNYYYDLKGGGDLRQSQDYIARYNQLKAASIKSSYIQAVSGISYLFKLWAFVKEFYPDALSRQETPTDWTKQGNFLYNCLSETDAMRNNQCHRGMEPAQSNGAATGNSKYWKKLTYDNVAQALTIMAQLVQDNT